MKHIKQKEKYIKKESHRLLLLPCGKRNLIFTFVIISIFIFTKKSRISTNLYGNINLKNYGKKRVLGKQGKVTKYQTELLIGYKLTNTFELKKRNGRKLPIGKTD